MTNMQFCLKIGVLLADIMSAIMNIGIEPIGKLIYRPCYSLACFSKQYNKNAYL